LGRGFSLFFFTRP